MADNDTATGTSAQNQASTGAGGTTAKNQTAQADDQGSGQDSAPPKAPSCPVCGKTPHDWSKVHPASYGGEL